MRFRFACALLSLPLAAQVVTVLPSGHTLAQYRVYGIRACNSSASDMRATASMLFTALEAQHIRLATYSEIQQAVTDQKGLSWQRKALLAISITGGVTTALMSTDQIKIKEQYKAAIPLFSAGLALAQQFIREPAVSAPDNLIPAAGVSLPAGACAEFEHPGIALSP